MGTPQQGSVHSVAQRTQNMETSGHLWNPGSPCCHTGSSGELAGDLAAPVPWQLTHQYALGQAGQQVGGSPVGSLPPSQLLSANAGEIPAENCLNGRIFSALHMLEQSSFHPHEM